MASTQQNWNVQKENLLHHIYFVEWDYFCTRSSVDINWKAIYSIKKMLGIIYYLENKVGVVDFAKGQGLEMFLSSRDQRACGL